MAQDPIRTVIEGGFAHGGFGFILQDRRRYGVHYGTAYAAPSWTARLIEGRGDVTLLGLKERGWGDHQDVMILQKHAAGPDKPAP